MRRLIAALQVSLDGFIEGTNGEIDWIKSWEDPFDILDQIDTCILGGRMYPGYESYWGAILKDPKAVSPFTGKAATQGEVDYARFTSTAQHVVLSRTIASVAWANTRIVRSVEEVAELKRHPGKDMHAVGGASLVYSLLEHRLVDELRVVVQPVLLGTGKSLFGSLTSRRELKLLDVSKVGDHMARLTYAVRGLEREAGLPP